MPARLLGVRVRILIGLTMLAASCATVTPPAADLQFALQMIPHHELGLRMATIAVVRANDVRVRELGFEMQNYQSRELATLKKIAASRAGDGHVHPVGMLTEAEEAELTVAAGADFDRLWLHQMTRHHQGAVEMARHEVDTGRRTDVRAIAQEIITVQTKQIDEMRSADIGLTAAVS